jgi:hypothetical protein
MEDSESGGEREPEAYKELKREIEAQMDSELDLGTEVEVTSESESLEDLNKDGGGGGGEENSSEEEPSVQMLQDFVISETASIASHPIAPHSSHQQFFEETVHREAIYQSEHRRGSHRHRPQHPATHQDDDDDT